MIERREIRGNTIFIDHERGEIHFSEKSSIICLKSVFGKYNNGEEIFPESLFGEFRIPLNGGNGQTIEQKENPPVKPDYKPDELFCNSIDNKSLKNIMGKQLKPSKTDDVQMSYDEILSSDDIPLIVDCIVNSPYADVLLHISPKKLVSKDQLQQEMEGNRGVLDELISYGLLKENQKSELFFTFKGLVVRGELAKITEANTVEYSSQSVLI